MTEPIDFSLLRRTMETVVSEEELKKKLQKKTPLRIKYGVDVTAPFLHIGHAVNLWMMRHFQECGHKVVFLIGDFTTRIGDPTGKSEVRKTIDPKDIEKNALLFIDQVSKILLTNPKVFEVRRNSEWFDKMPLSEFLSLASMVTHAKLIQRDMFQKRIETQQEIFIHEMLYPLLQGYDSVMLDSDLTIVGTDQLFNELMGRFYQERFSQEPQVVMTSKITPGTNGKEKQSKSLGNYIAIDDTARDQFGKVMSLPDFLIIPYMEVYTTLSLSDVQSAKEEMAHGTNPMIFKKKLAEAIVSRYWGDESARFEREWFENTFSKRQTPEDTESLDVAIGPQGLIEALRIKMPEMSKGELLRLADAGGISINGEKIDRKRLADGAVESGAIVKVGKRRWFRVSVL